MPQQGFLFQYSSNFFIVAYPIDSLIHTLARQQFDKDINK